MQRRLISSGSSFEREIGFSRALEQAGASLGDVVRVTYILPRGEDFAQCWPILRKHFGEVRPAATMISARLIDPRIQIEIEVTARRQAAG